MNECFEDKEEGMITKFEESVWKYQTHLQIIFDKVLNK